MPVTPTSCVSLSTAPRADKGLLTVGWACYLVVRSMKSLIAAANSAGLSSWMK